MNARLNPNLLNPDLLEATRLTRAGQLLEATALIQRALGGRFAPSPATEATPATGTPAAHRATEPPLEGSCRVIDIGPFVADAEPAQREPADAAAKAGEPAAEAVVPPLAERLGATLRDKLFKLRGAVPAFEPIVPGHVPGHVPEAVPDGARFISASYTNAAGTRSYKLYVPSNYCGEPLPLVVMLHGCTQNPDDFAAGTGMNELAEREPCLVLYPAQSAGANGSKCWNWFKPSDQRAEHGEPSLIAGMTREVAASYNADRRRIYIAGLSAGGAMATTMAVAYPDLYAAAGIHSGLPHAAAHDLPSALAAMQQGSARAAGIRATGAGTGRETPHPVPVIVFHGDRDTTVHPRNGEQVIVQFAPAGVRTGSTGAGSKPRASIERGQVPNGRAYTRTTYHHPNGSPHVEQWTVHGAGHAWSGGSSRGSYTDPQGPDAAKEMLRFFLAHPAGGKAAPEGGQPQ
ncbi:extracellular catalytic domain type 1 short-chain-length polyhydroxyalkanoate depolymerase [Aromatoleum anaerobium]|uniref:PHB depolymerase family esterase n=1 Tax=Aromatoleum anaerobium TaxID=182180 RepID=A0ABX1PG85_9RHOO|nr:PHB depolymerase family esterase [Aromatoleum anaerobium]MCK0507503.1 PHB depolymerase family esterase [Aromatoleum anaerobium]